jgi:hypothetical protein
MYDENGKNSYPKRWRGFWTGNSWQRS